ncbi:MAG: hypothetical protein IJV27_00355 [Prevotella sp.]|nr:hypothetical protein [Prevotella sp.]
MKKILSIAMLFVISMTMYAQKDVTKFLGIPVDGTKSAMIQKLKEKGFTYNSSLNCLEGEFNGRDVYVKVGINNNKVYRIMLQDATSSNEGDIKIRFNNLCRQFEKNKKYISASLSDQTLSESEDISTQMVLYNKRYEAAYYQLSEITEDEGIEDAMERAFKKSVWFMITKGKRYDQYYINMYYDNGYNQSDGEDL